MNLEIVKARNRGWGFLIGMEKLRVHFKSKDIFTFALVIIPRQPQWGYCGANENLNYFFRRESILSPPQQLTLFLLSEISVLLSVLRPVLDKHIFLFMTRLPQTLYTGFFLTHSEKASQKWGFTTPSVHFAGDALLLSLPPSRQASLIVLLLPLVLLFLPLPLPFLLLLLY